MTRHGKGHLLNPRNCSHKESLKLEFRAKDHRGHTGLEGWQILSSSVSL